MVTYNFTMKLVFTLFIRNDITETQIRSYLVSYEADFASTIDTLINDAPSAAQAVNNGTTFKLKVDPFTTGIWQVYPKTILSVTVADNITLLQVKAYLETGYDLFKADIRAMVAAAPAAVNAQISDWHVHRLSGSVDELE